MYIALKRRTHNRETGSSRSECPRRHETVEEVLLPQVHHEFLLWGGCSREAKSRVHEAGSDKEIFTSMAWIRSFNSMSRFMSSFAMSFIPLMSLMKLRLYQAIELNEEGCNVYFEGGMRNDEHFNAHDYWLSISRDEHLGLSRSHTSTIRNPILRMICKMITYGLCQRTTRYDKVQKNDLWLLKDVVRSLSALIYCRDLDTTTLRDLIDSDGKLIPDDP
nr:hypothetical protein [Tanacetum cinerariifolium]